MSGLKKKEKEQWLVTQHAKRIQKGDRVVIWAFGEKAGIYTIGEVIENPCIRPLNKNQEKYWTGKNDIIKFEDKHSVLANYLKLIINKLFLKMHVEKSHSKNYGNPKTS